MVATSFIDTHPADRVAWRLSSKTRGYSINVLWHNYEGLVQENVILNTDNNKLLIATR